MLASFKNGCVHYLRALRSEPWNFRIGRGLVAAILVWVGRCDGMEIPPADGHRFCYALMYGEGPPQHGNEENNTEEWSGRCYCALPTLPSMDAMLKYI